MAVSSIFVFKFLVISGNVSDVEPSTRRRGRAQVCDIVTCKCCIEISVRGYVAVAAADIRGQCCVIQSALRNRDITETIVWPILNRQVEILLR